MPKFGESSRNNLNGADPKLQKLFNEIVKTYDCKVICGFRGKDEQQKAYKERRSKVQFPHSKHNRLPAQAVDVAPYPIDWKDLNRFYHFGGYVKAKAEEMGINIRWGGDWDGDLDIKDQNFDDLPHFELLPEDDGNDPK